MTMNLTKGGLSPAKIKNLVTQEEVKFMFNPFEFSISKTNTWEKETGKGLNVPRHNFQSGGAQTLSLKLHFDSLAQQSDVRAYTAPLWTMMMIDEQNKNQTTGKGSPPVVAFEWGRLYFEAIITTMTEHFTLFMADGTPVRCEVDVTLEQYTVSIGTPPSTSGGGQTAPQSTTMTEGDRLDHVSGSGSGGTSDYRPLAEQNNIDNPMNVPPGTELKV